MIAGWPSTSLSSQRRRSPRRGKTPLDTEVGLRSGATWGRSEQRRTFRFVDGGDLVALKKKRRNPLSGFRPDLDCDGSGSGGYRTVTCSVVFARIQRTDRNELPSARTRLRLVAVGATMQPPSPLPPGVPGAPSDFLSRACVEKSPLQKLWGLLGIAQHVSCVFYKFMSGSR